MGRKGEPKFKYNKKTYPVEFIEMSKKGYTLSEICSAWNISRNTLHVWSKDRTKPEMVEAVLIGKMHREAWFVKMGKAAMMGKVKGASTGHFVWITRNCLGWNEEPDPYDQQDVIEDVEF